MSDAAPTETARPRLAAAALVVGAGGGLVFGVALWLWTVGFGLELKTLPVGKTLGDHLPVVDAFAFAGIALGVVMALWASRQTGLRARVPQLLGAGSLVLFAARLSLAAPRVAALVGVTALALVLALLVARTLPARLTLPSTTMWWRASWAVPATLSFALYTAWSVGRHLRFGSGSWDMGCYNHNIWLLASGKAFSLDATSSVLGDAAFWGGTNHFMPSLLLVAPLAYTGLSWALLVVQAGLIAAMAWPLSWLARRLSLSPLVALPLNLVVLFHVGVQSAAHFDVHEIAPVPLLFLLAVVCAEQRRVWWMLACIAVLVGTKESSWLYGAGIGAWLLLFRPGLRAVGGGVVVVCGAGFYVVTGVLQPALLEEGARMIHALRFAAFQASSDGSMVDATLGVLTHPGRAVVVLVAPLEKLVTLVFTLQGLSFLPLGAPEALLLSLPNWAERFLSDKREMWGMAFHYSLVTVGFLSYGALLTLARLRAFVVDGGRVSAHRFDVFVAAWLLLSAGLSMALLSPVAPELSRFERPYYAGAPEVERYRRALLHVGDDDAVVAQNHFLPHVAMREHIWQPDERFVERADVVILDPRSSPWPHNTQHVRWLVKRLLADERFVVVFSEETTVVFARAAPHRTPVAVDSALTSATASSPR